MGRYFLQLIVMRGGNIGSNYLKNMLDEQQCLDTSVSSFVGLSYQEFLKNFYFVFYHYLISLNYGNNKSHKQAK